METLHRQAENYRRIEQAIAFLETNFRGQPSLEEIAASVNLSKYHFQRVFKRWAGVTPTQFLHFLTVEYAKGKLQEFQSILTTALDAGLSGPSRLHDMFVTFEAMTPGEYKALGSGLEIVYGFHPTPFGEAMLAATERGICALFFVPPEDRTTALAELTQEWPQALFTENPTFTHPLVERAFAPLGTENTGRLHLLVKGTNFQVQVWQALLAIPSGALVTYQAVAEGLGKPTAARAVGNAVAMNPISYLIPCHRVITKAGKAHRYRWGTARKKALIGWEASRQQPTG